VVDLVLLQFGETEVLGRELLVDAGQEVLALVDDLLVLVVARRLEGRRHVRTARDHRAAEQHRGPGHLEDLVPQLAQ